MTTIQTIVQNILLPIETAALEDKLAILKDKWWQLVTAKPSNITKAKLAGKYAFPSDLEKLWLNIIDADPTKNKAYLQWMILKVFSSPIWLRKMYGVYREDLNMLNSNLAIYDRLKVTKKLPPELRDINRIKDDGDLFDKLLPFKEADTRSQREKGKDIEQAFFDKKAAVLFHDSAALKIVIPKTHEASCYFGINTKWCTTAKNDPETFEDYAAMGKLYIILHKPTNRRWQFHFEEQQFMDEKDHTVDWSTFMAEPFINELRELFHKVAAKDSLIPFMKSYTTKEVIKFFTSGNTMSLTESFDVTDIIDVLHIKPIETDIKDALFTKDIITKHFGWSEISKALQILYGKISSVSSIVKDALIEDSMGDSDARTIKLLTDLFMPQMDYSNKVLKFIAVKFVDTPKPIVKNLTFTDEQWLKLIEIEPNFDVVFIKTKGKDKKAQKDALELLINHVNKSKKRILIVHMLLFDLVEEKVINMKMVKELLDEKVIDQKTFKEVMTYER